MAQTTFFADTLTITWKTSGGTTLDVGALRGVTITGEYELVELHAMDSIHREAIARKNAKVSVTAGMSKFHPDVFGKILGTETADTDVDGNSEADTTQAQFTDSNTVPVFDIWGTVTGANSETYKCKVTNVAFENVPFDAPEGEFMAPELTGIGDKMYLAYKTV